jgi:hypothetical protein
LERTTWRLASYSTAISLLDLGSILLYLLLSIGVWLKRSRGEFLYVIALLLLTLDHTVDVTKGPPTQSAPRYMMAMLPCLIVLAGAGRNAYVDQIVRWTFIVLQAVFAIYFFAGSWVV